MYIIIIIRLYLTRLTYLPSRFQYGHHSDRIDHIRILSIGLELACNGVQCGGIFSNANYVLGCRDGAVVRALASHQCGPGSIPGLGVICGLSLLVLYSAPRGFLRALRFPLSSKTNICIDLIYFHCSFQFTVSPISAPALERLDT